MFLGLCTEAGGSGKPGRQVEPAGGRGRLCASRTSEDSCLSLGSWPTHVLKSFLEPGVPSWPRERAWQGWPGGEGALCPLPACTGLRPPG